MMLKSKYRSLITVIVLFGNLVGLPAQDQGHVTDSIKIYELGNKAFSLRSSQPDSALLLAETALQLAEQTRDTQAQVSLLRIKGVVHYGQNQLKDAYHNFEQSYVLAKAIQFREGRLLINLGNVLFRQEQYEEALEKFQGALDLSAKKDTALWMDALNNFGSAHFNSGNFKAAIPYFEQSLSLQRAVGNLQAQLPIIYNIAYAQSKIKAIETSDQTIQEGIRLANELDEASWVAKFHTRQGIDYSDQGYYIQSIQAHQKALAIQDSLGNQNAVANALYSIGTVRQDNKDFELGHEYFQRALVLFRKANRIRNVANALNAIGNSFKQQGEYGQALNYFQQAVALYEQQEERQASLAFPFFNLGDSYAQLNQLDSAAFYLNKALRRVEGLDRKVIEALVFSSLGKVAQKQGLEQQAIQYYEEAVVAAREENLRREELEASWLLYQALKRQNRPLEALNYLERHQTLQDSMFNEESTREITRIESQFVFEQEKKELAFQNEIEKQQLDDEIRRQRTWQYVLAGALLLSLLALFLFVRFQRFRKAAALEQERLNNQINLQKLTYEQKERERLQDLDAFKSRFFANISHELRTPITLINTPIEQYLKEQGSKIGDKGRKTLRRVLKNGRSLLQLVEELLDLSRLESDKLQLEESVTPLLPFTRQLHGAFESKAAIQQIQYDFSSNLAEDEHYWIDRNRLVKIINNLLSNALKFTPVGGSVLMSVEQEEGQLVIRVKDTGRGIPPEDLPHVFERYFQTNRNDLPSEGGLGVGLALSKELSKLMQGELSVQSEWEKGATFRLQIPLRKAENVEEYPDLELSAAEPAIEATNASLPILPGTFTSDGKKPRILIVEDNADMQQLIYDLLADSYECQIARHGAEAWDWMTNDQIKPDDTDLIISDIMMPHMDGYELLQRIKQHSAWQKKPVVMLTARADNEDKLEALRLGVDDYLLKPFSADELSARIANLLSNYQERKSFQEKEKFTVEVAFEPTLSADQVWLETLETIAKDALEKKLDITAAYLASQMAVSERQLLRRIKSLTGLSSKQYIQTVKLQKARHLLENKTYNTISEVAYACGFNTPTYFGKIFEKHFGKKPRAYLG